MISGELETNGDHWRTLAVSLVRLSLSHHDQTSGVRRGQEGPMSPSPSQHRSHCQPGHIWPWVTRVTAASWFSKDICLFRKPREHWILTTRPTLTSGGDLTLYCPDRVLEPEGCQHFYCSTPNILLDKVQWSDRDHVSPFLRHLSETKLGKTSSI